MADKLLLFLGSERLSAQRWQQGRLHGNQLFANDAAGHAAFAAWLRPQRQIPCLVLADLVEEDFRFESIPHVGGRNHAAIVHRKLGQFYRDTPLRHARTQYREREGRRDDRVLFSALTNPGLIMPWLKILLANEAAVAGIYSVPFISRQLVRHLSSSSHLLLLTWQKCSGLRETYYRDGHISFSRLTPFADGSDFTERLWSEFDRTYQYLGRLSLLPADQPLDVCIVCNSGDRQKLQATLTDSERIRYRFENVQELAERIGLKKALPDSDATPLLLHALTGRPPPNQYANSDHMHFHDLRKVRRLLTTAAAAVVAFCAAWSGSNTWQALDVRESAEATAIQTAVLAAQYRSIAATFPPFPVPVDRMRAAVAAIDKLAPATHSPKPFLALLGQKLAEFPMIQLNSLSWRSAETTGSAAELSGRNQADLHAATPSAHKEILLDGEIVPAHNLRATIDQIQRFRAALGQAGLPAKPVVMPFDLDASASLNVDLDGAAGPRGAAFVLQVLWGGRAMDENPPADTR